jgi:hypothetical protein
MAPLVITSPFTLISRLGTSPGSPAYEWEEKKPFALLSPVLVQYIYLHLSFQEPENSPHAFHTIFLLSTKYTTQSRRKAISCYSCAFTTPPSIIYAVALNSPHHIATPFSQDPPCKNHSSQSPSRFLIHHPSPFTIAGQNVICFICLIFAL